MGSFIPVVTMLVIFVMLSYEMSASFNSSSSSPLIKDLLALTYYLVNTRQWQILAKRLKLIGPQI